MKTSADLWAVGFDDFNRASEVRAVIESLAGPAHYFHLLDVGVLRRSSDGSLRFEERVIMRGDHLLQHGPLGLLAGFALAVPPLTSEAVAQLFDTLEKEASKGLGIDEEFRREIASMLRPNSSALLVLDIAENIPGILAHLRGLGGRILKTSVDMARVHTIQQILAEKIPEQAGNAANGGGINSIIATNGGVVGT